MIDDELAAQDELLIRASREGRSSLAQWFACGHLRPELRAISRRFGALALVLIETLPRDAETTTALRYLLISKDAAVRAAMLRTDPAR